jgi:cell division protein FtsQ
VTATRRRHLARKPALGLPKRPTRPLGLGKRRSRRDGRVLRPRASAGGPNAPVRVFAVGLRARLATSPAAIGASLRRLGPLRVAILLAVALALGGGWLWFRHSSVVAIQRVTVTGLSGPGAGHIRAALISAARGMSTLDVQTARLHTVVQPFPVVRALKVSAQFPHGLRIHVIEQLPVAALSAAGRRLAVSADGTVLRDLHPARSLPAVSVRELPVGQRVTNKLERQELAVLAAAPAPLRARSADVVDSPAHGIVVVLRDGPKLFFGSPGQLRDKWLAAAAVLANSSSAGAAYIDLTDPQRPAAG